MQQKHNKTQKSASVFAIGQSKPAISRRSFICGALGIAAVAAVGTAVGVTQCHRTEEPEAAEDAASGPIAVSNDAVFTTEGCEYIEDATSAVTLVAQAHLPYGTMLLPGDDLVVACMLPCDTSDPLTKIGVLSLSTGQMTTVLENAVSASEGFNIYDARVNSRGLVWVESDILNGVWRVYTAELLGIQTPTPSLGAPSLAAEGTSDWDLPELACSGTFAFWQMCPNATGPLKKEHSLLNRIAFGSPKETAKVVWESAGRFACSPSASGEAIAIAPRADVSGTAYQLTLLDAAGGESLDEMLLPNAMKPAYIAYGPTGFSFAFEGIYDYGEGISQLGTYTPAGSGVDGEWFRFPRTPYTEPAWCGNWFVVKSTSVIAGVDLANKKYFSMSPEHATQGYGEFLASSGPSGRFATYANIDYTPLNGTRITECNVRVWQPASV